MTATFPATEGRQNEFKLKSFCRQYVQCFAKRLCVVDLPSLCICRDTDPGGILEELTSYTIFHLTYLFVCSLNHPLYNMQCAWRKKKSRIYYIRYWTGEYVESLPQLWNTATAQLQMESRSRYSPAFHTGVSLEGELGAWADLHMLQPLDLLDITFLTMAGTRSNITLGPPKPFSLFIKIEVTDPLF